MLLIRILCLILYHKSCAKYLQHHINIFKPLSNHYWTTIEHLLDHCWTIIKHLSNVNWTTIEPLLNHIKHLSDYYWPSIIIKHLLNYHWIYIYQIFIVPLY